MTDALNDPTRLPVFGGDDDPDATRVGPMRRPSAHALAGRIGPRADPQPVAQAPAQAVPLVTPDRNPASPPPPPPPPTAQPPPAPASRPRRSGPTALPPARTPG